MVQYRCFKERKGEEEMKSKACIVCVNTRLGHVCQPAEFESIRKGVEWAKESGGFYYRIYDAVTKKLVRKGFCND